MSAVFTDIDPASYRPHALHASDRMWPETNCYVDLWIEVLSSFKTTPEAMLGFTVTQDFEGDQFTFFKTPLEDIEALYGIRCSELAIFDDVEGHVHVQIGRGRLAMLELDSYFLPDTQGTSYRTEHGKTTVAVNRLDSESRAMDYFHNGGFYHLEGEDFDGIFQRNRAEGALPFLPYTEFVKFPASRPSDTHLRQQAARLLRHHLARRPETNPIAAFANVFPAQVEALADRPFEHFHKYAFNTLRQFGANFELLASHLAWLSPDGAYLAETAGALKISEQAKTIQFQLARAIARRKFEPLSAALEPAALAWDELMAGLSAKAL